MRVRDPIHGTIPVADSEVGLIDSPFYQRLRHIKQLGFGELAFPGATHTRHAHCLGAMHVASRLFDAVVSPLKLADADVARLRRAVRVATLLHDVGHLPLSHAAESIAPARAALKLPAWLGNDSGQASHEDFTAKLLLDSSLTHVLQTALEGTGFGPEAIASLVAGVEPPGGSPFQIGGRDVMPLLRQLVSGELDADRMDYLLRDSFFTGVKYGAYDLDWIIQNLWPAELNGKAYLALSKVAVFAFEDFLLSRYHMFVSVYYHHTAICFDELLRRYYADARGEFEVPTDPNGFLACDDVALWHTLRRSKSRWAERIVRRRGFKMIAQVTAQDAGYDLDALVRELKGAGIEHFRTASKGVLSKYFVGGGTAGLYVLDRGTGRLTPITQYTPLYQRYADTVTLERVYVDDARSDEARAILQRSMT
ncbi:MAG: HD domain-containing protein [Deltaproteobacteria bacterium]|nr:HD domain-containing protein [Deltaproteobacteria bacterium]